MFGCLPEDSAEDLKTVGWDQCWLQKRRQLGSFTDKKRTPEFVAEIQAMMDNNPNKSIMSTARDMGVFQFLIRQVVHEDIHYFSQKMRKAQFSSHAIDDQRKDHTSKI